MAASKNQVSTKDFFTTASRMTLEQFASFLRNVLMQMDPKEAPPVMVWGPAGIAKSSVIEEVFGKTEKGLKTVILSQIGALDSNGLPHINQDGSTVFSPTETFGRGKQHLFLDELNNSAPSTMACIQNLLSAKTIGGDKYDGIYILAACNPPSTNSLSMDLNHPSVSRCMHIVLEYSLTDFLNYAMSTGEIHPAIVGFHKKTNGNYLQANWSMHGSQYQVPEPSANEPYPCPRSWTIASKFMTALSKASKEGGFVDYTIMKPVVEGCVGIMAANEFASTYAFMAKIPDVAKVFSGEVTSKNFSMIKDEIAVQYITMSAIINFCIGEIAKAEREKITSLITKPSKSNKEGSDAYRLLSGIHRSIIFLGEVTSAELASNAIMAITTKLRNSSMNNATDLMGKFLNGVDPDSGLSRESISKFAKRVAQNDASLNSSVGV